MGERKEMPFPPLQDQQDTEGEYVHLTKPVAAGFSQGFPLAP